MSNSPVIRLFGQRRSTECTQDDDDQRWSTPDREENKPMRAIAQLNGYRVRCRSCHHFWTAVSMSIAQTASAVTSNPTTTAFVVGLAWSE